MERIGYFEICDIYDERKTIKKRLYIENGEFGFKLHCTICDDCDGHFTKLNNSNLGFLGYKLVEGSISIEGKIF